MVSTASMPGHRNVHLRLYTAVAMPWAYYTAMGIHGHADYMPTCSAYGGMHAIVVVG